jgi:hypothetical protein
VLDTEAVKLAEGEPRTLLVNATTGFSEEETGMLVIDTGVAESVAFPELTPVTTELGTLAVTEKPVKSSSIGFDAGVELAPTLTAEIERGQ